MGDAVLRAVADELGTIAGAAVVRDGGDEMLLVGAPTGTSLRDDLASFRQRWPARFRERFPGADPVLTRIVTARTRGARLLATREALGRRIGALKDQPLGELGAFAVVDDP